MNTRRIQPAALAQKNPQPKQPGPCQALRCLGRLGTLTLAMALLACGGGGGGGGSAIPPNSVAVTYNYTTLPAGCTLSAALPGTNYVTKGGSTSALRPSLTCLGYTLSYSTTAGGASFNFGTDTLNADTVLYAKANRSTLADADGNGLIEVTSIEELDAMRYNPTGSGKSSISPVAFSANANGATSLSTSSAISGFSDGTASTKATVTVGGVAFTADANGVTGLGAAGITKTLYGVSNGTASTKAALVLGDRGRSDGCPATVTAANAVDGVAHGDGSAGSGCYGYELTGDLDFSNARSYNSGTVNSGLVSGCSAPCGWSPIGTETSSFTATLHGRGHSLSKLYIRRSGDSGVGLLGYTGSGVFITDLGLREVDVLGDLMVGALIGVDVTGSGRSTVRNSYVRGGQVQANTGVAGGMIGSNLSFFVDGGVVLTSISSSGNRSLSHNHVRGVTVSSSGPRVGGLMGHFNGGNNDAIRNSYATGNVTGSDYVGGLLGAFGPSGPALTTTLANSYATGAVALSSGATGTHLAGVVGGLSGSPSAMFFDSSTTGQSDSNATGKTTAQMKGTAASGNLQGSDLGSAFRLVTGDYPLLCKYGQPANCPSDSDLVGGQLN